MARRRGAPIVHCVLLTLKGILVVSVCPWYITGMPSSPSQQSSSTLRQPCSSTWCKHTQNNKRKLLFSKKKSKYSVEKNCYAYLTVKLNRGLPFELVPRQISVVGGLNVVIGQGILQLLRVYLGFLSSRRKIIFIHQEPGIGRGRYSLIQNNSVCS